MLHELFITQKISSHKENRRSFHRQLNTSMQNYFFRIQFAKEIMSDTGGNLVWINLSNSAKA